MSARRTVATVVALKAAAAATLALGMVLSPASHAHVPADVSALRMHTAEEDSPDWRCDVDGNRVCGPGNATPAGCYSDTGVMVAPWPCFVVANPDGSSAVWTR